MKKFINLFFLSFLFIYLGCATSHSVSKNSSDQVHISQLIEKQQFVYNANAANPLRTEVLNILPNGASQLRNLSPGYQLLINKDSLSVNLPFFGRAYSSNPGSTDNGIKFTSRHFNYSYTKTKKNIYRIVITGLHQKDVSSINLDVSDNGYGTLNVQSNTRDMMSFYGQILPIDNDIR